MFILISCARARARAPVKIIGPYFNMDKEPYIGNLFWPHIHSMRSRPRNSHQIITCDALPNITGQPELTPAATITAIVILAVIIVICLSLSLSLLLVILIITVATTISIISMMSTYISLLLLLLVLLG